MIETDRLFLCIPNNNNLCSIEKLYRDGKVRQYLGDIVPDEYINEKVITLQKHWDVYKFGLWIVYEKVTNKIIGSCGLQHSQEGVELYYMFFPEFWKQGVAKEALLVSIEYGLNVLKLDKIIAITQGENIRSCQLLKKVGMTHIETFECFNANQYLSIKSKF